MSTPNATRDGFDWPDLIAADDLHHRLAHLALHAGGGDMRVGLWAMWRAVVGEVRHG